jgi:lipoyl(octanoyl) transferase
MKQQALFTDLGKNQPYQPIWDLQEKLLQENVKVKSEIRSGKYHVQEVETNGTLHITNQKLQTINRLLFVEHNPVYTLGKSGDISHVLINDEERSQKGIEFFKINRGGDITFHGPEQLVGYPIFDLEYFKTDLGWYLRSLEEVIILTMAEYGLKGDRSQGETGVWLDPDIKGKERKICAMGIRCSRWITMHGFAFNVNTDLAYFNYIIPCGIQNKQVTSLEKELGYKVPLDEVKEKVKRNFEKVFDLEIVDDKKAI